MARARSAQSNSPEEIPLARRSSPIRRPTKKEGKFLLLFFISIFISAIFLGFYFSDIGSQSEVAPNKSNNDSSYERLLGHFPYPEAARDLLVEVFPGLSLHSDTYNALIKMRSAASSDGIKLVLLSGFRSHELQRQIFYGRKADRNQIAIERAKVSAPPGYSEHSTGYAIDLGDGFRRETDFETSFEQTSAFKWLEQNAPRYHFVLSFPKNNPQKVSYEPWHWRFEGTVDALKQFQDANEFVRSKTILIDD